MGAELSLSHYTYTPRFLQLRMLAGMCLTQGRTAARGQSWSSGTRLLQGYKPSSLQIQLLKSRDLIFSDAYRPGSLHD